MILESELNERHQTWDTNIGPGALADRATVAEAMCIAGLWCHATSLDPKAVIWYAVTPPHPQKAYVHYRGFDSSFESWVLLGSIQDTGDVPALEGHKWDPSPLACSLWCLTSGWTSHCTVLPTLILCLAMGPELRGRVGCRLNPLKAWTKINLVFFISWLCTLFVTITQSW